ncbi:Uncharacterised protein [Serratia rubidaea]|nr:Uncharacterised protein [Serratia rubidaea]
MFAVLLRRFFNRHQHFCAGDFPCVQVKDQAAGAQVVLLQVALFLRLSSSIEWQAGR